MLLLGMSSDGVGPAFGQSKELGAEEQIQF